MPARYPREKKRSANTAFALSSSSSLSSSSTSQLAHAHEELAPTTSKTVNTGSNYRGEVDLSGETKESNDSSLPDMLHSMMRALRPGGGVVSKVVEVEVRQTAEDPEDDVDEEESGSTFTELFTFLELPDGIMFRAMYTKFGRFLLVRPCFTKIFDHWWERASLSTFSDDDDIAGDVLIGTPGIGKSMFLFYALYRLAQMDWSGAIVFQDTSGEMTLFEGDRFSHDQNNARKALMKFSTVYLCDGLKKGDFKSCVGPFILTSSPNEDVWKRVSEKELCRPPIVAPVCTLGEMQAYRKVCFPKLTSQTVVEVFKIAGGIPRILKMAAKAESFNVKLAIEEKVRQIDIEACKTAIFYGRSKNNNEAHSLLHLCPCEGGSMLKWTVKFGTAFIERAVVEHMVIVRREELLSFLASSETFPEFPTLRGVLYEGYAIRRLQEGGEFRCRELLVRDPSVRAQRTRGEEFIIQVPPSTEHVFGRLAELDHLEVGHHYRPMYNTLETVDSFMSREWLFQVTVANEHNVKITGLNVMLKHLREIGDTASKRRLFFVVPESSFKDGFRCVQQLKTKTGNVASRAGEAAKVEQYVMCIPLSRQI